MNNSTFVESYFDTAQTDTTRTKNRIHYQATELGFNYIDTLATVLTNMREPLTPELCESVGQLIKEMNMMTFMAYEKTVKH